MPHPSTNALVERIFRQSHGVLRAHATQFFGGSYHQERAGIDADNLVHQVLEQILEQGTLHKMRKPLAYVKTAITNAGISANRRLNHYEQIVPQLLDPDAIDPPSHDAATTDQLAAASVLEAAIPALPQRAQRVAKAKIEHPDLNNSQIAAQLDISPDTVRRALEDMQQNDLLRAFVQSGVEPLPATNDNTPQE